MFFNKKKSPKKNAEQDVAARKIADRVIKIQIRIADFLNAKTAHYTKSHKQILLFVVSLFFSALSLYLIFNSLL